MSEPIVVEFPHKLGRAAARARVDGGIGKLAGMFPGGAAVDHRWEGDTLHFTASRLAVGENKVRAEIDLPPFLALFAVKIREKLAEVAPKLLE